MILVGIDPGVSGALVALDDSERVLDVLMMPTMAVGSKKRVHAAAVAAWLRQFDNAHAVLEQVGAMPGQGTASMFSFGHAMGALEGVLGALAVPYTLCTPQRWKRAAGLIGTDKDAARSRAIQLYPDLRLLDAKGKGQAVADAILIARFGGAWSPK